MKLSPKHEKFAVLIALEAKSASDAFRDVYPHSKAWKPDSVWVRASKLAAKVQPRITELQEKDVAKKVLSRNEVAIFLSNVVRNEKTEETRTQIMAAKVLAELLGYKAPEKIQFDDRSIPARIANAEDAELE